MKVLCLLTTPPGSDPRVTELVLDTVRTGFPTADLVFYNNHDTVKAEYTKFKEIGAPLFRCQSDHYSWIKDCLWVWRDSDEPLIFLDGDVIFWESVEWWEPNELLSGFHVRSHINPFSRSYYFSRLHTSLLWIRSAKELWSLMTHDWHEHAQFKPYLRRDYISPHYSWIMEQPVYYDTCAELYQCLAGQFFPDKMLNCYDHVNSAGFYEAMLSRLSEHEARGFANVHNIAKENPAGLRGLWKETKVFYQNHAAVLHDYLHSNPLA